MITLMIVLLVICALLFVPVGVRLNYQQKEGCIWLKVGFLKLKLYPRPQKEQKANQNPEGSRPKQKKTVQSRSGKLSDYMPVLHIVLEFVSDFRRKLWVQNFELKLILADDDPCDLAVHYGEAWAAVGCLFPLLEQCLKIKKRNIEVLCDFVETQTTFTFHADLLITFGNLLIITLQHGVRGLKEYYNLSKNIKAVQ